MIEFDLDKVVTGLSATWVGFLRDWDRCLRAANHPATTRYVYVLAAAQLARYLDEESPDPEAVQAALDPCAVRRAHVEAFQAWMIATRSAGTALHKHKALRQFFVWLVEDEQAVPRSPMDRVRMPRTPTKLVPVMSAQDTRALLQARKGKSFLQVRDEALIRLYANTGARLSEIAALRVSDVDLRTESVHIHGKGAKDRRVRIGPRTARAVSRYLRARATHRGTDLPELWLADRGARALSPNGVKIMLRRVGQAAGVPGVHAHRWRHTYAHEWKRAGGDNRGPHAGHGLGLRGHAPTLRGQCRSRTRPGNPTTHRDRRRPLTGPRTTHHPHNENTPTRHEQTDPRPRTGTRTDTLSTQTAPETVGQHAMSVTTRPDREN
jgi:integrase/recombinase XerC